MAGPWNQEAAARQAAKGKMRMVGKLERKRLAMRGGGGEEGVCIPGIHKDKEKSYQRNSEPPKPHQFLGLPTAGKVCRAMIMRSCEHAMSNAQEDRPRRRSRQGNKKKEVDSSGGQSKIARNKMRGVVVKRR